MTTEQARPAAPHRVVIVGAGFGGLALVCLGVTLIAIDVRLRDSAARQAQSRRVNDALDELLRLSEQGR